LNSCS